MTQLGEMQPLKPYKFLQENVLEGIFPFSRLRTPYNILLLILFYFFWGVGIYYLYGISGNFLLAGVFSALGISLWTLGIFAYAGKLRRTEIEDINPVVRKFLVNYLEKLFNPVSIVFGVILFAFTLTIFFTSFSEKSTGLFSTLFSETGQESLPPLLLLYIFVISFDVCYRFGLSLHIMLFQLERNLLLGRFLANPKLNRSFNPTNIRALEKADLYHYFAIASGILLFPLSLLDPVLLFSLFLYLVFAFFAASVNILHLRILYVRAIPRKIVHLLASAKFAYVGTVSKTVLPHVTPTLFVFDGRHIFLSTSIHSEKVSGLMKNRNIALCIDHRKAEDITKSRGVLVRGVAKVYGHDLRTGIFYVLVFGVRMLMVRFLFSRKYPNYLKSYYQNNKLIPRSWRTAPIISRTIIEIIPKRFSYWHGIKWVKVAF